MSDPCPDFNAQPDIAILMELAAAPRPWALIKHEDPSSLSAWTIIDAEGWMVTEVEVETERDRVVLQFLIDAVNNQGSSVPILREASAPAFTVEEDVEPAEGHS
ncbi:MAG TPA: hypothetical protein VGM54_10135 [Chthoniobacter sp.]|jgi:hypothetical protein